MKYAVKVFFETDNVLMADKMAGAIYNAFSDNEGLVNGIDVLVVPGIGPTGEDYEADEAWEEKVDGYMSAGFNSNPLPEGFPTL